jgi:hypothetical protein
MSGGGFEGVRVRYRVCVWGQGGKRGDQTNNIVPANCGSFFFGFTRFFFSLIFFWVLVVGFAGLI